MATLTTDGSVPRTRTACPCPFAQVRGAAGCGRPGSCPPATPPAAPLGNPQAHSHQQGPAHPDVTRMASF
jgi:hypothetical protein